MIKLNFNKILPTDLSRIELDAGNDTLTAEFDIKVGDKGEVVSFMEVIEFGKDSPSLAVKEAAAQLAKAILFEVRTRAAVAGEPRCVSCIGACCTDKEGPVRFTPADLERMVGGLGPDVVDSLTLYEDGTSWTGYTGEIKRGPLDPEKFEGQESGCVNLTEQGCRIYEFRPTVCREYSSFTCGEMYTEDPAKLVAIKEGKLTLRVVR